MMKGQEGLSTSSANLVVVEDGMRGSNGHRNKGDNTDVGMHIANVFSDKAEGMSLYETESLISSKDRSKEKELGVRNCCSNSCDSDDADSFSPSTNDNSWRVHSASNDEGTSSSDFHTMNYEKVRRYFKWFLITNCIFFLFLFAVIFIGADVEGNRVRDNNLPTENGSWAYSVSNVCGYDGDFMTFANENEARDDSNQVAHCGYCGECFTVQDIFIINETSETLTGTTMFCAKKVMNIFAGGGGRAAVVSCIEEKVGFTPACGGCWVDNVMCDYKNCLMTCIKSVFFYGESNNKGSDALNDCLNCDEVMCGPEFIQCAGANRRRAGIITDIDRDEDEELCEKVSDGWLAEAMAAGGISNR